MKTFNTPQTAIDYSVINPLETVELKLIGYKGQLRNHCFYVDGELHGEYKSYFSNGQLWEHFFYVNGKRHGEYKSYHDNGKLAYHSFYAGGKEIKLDHLAKDNRTPEENELVKATVGDNYFK